MHYTREQWRMFRLDRVPAATREGMEEHLAGCEVCLETYLDVIDQGDVKLAEKLLHPGFTERLIGRIAVGRITQHRRGVQAQAARGTGVPTTLRHYLVAAAVTAVLFAAGWFDVVTQTLPVTLRETTTVLEHLQSRQTAGWASRLVDRASSLITDFFRGEG